MSKKTAAKVAKKSEKPARKPTVPVKPTKAVPPRKAEAPKKPVEPATPLKTVTQTVTPSEPEQHMPGQVEVPPVTPELRAEQIAEQNKPIPAEGNNIASTHDRAHADTPPANDQPPVEKTFVSPPDNV